MGKSHNAETQHMGWAIEARARAQRLLLALHKFGESKGAALNETDDGFLFGALTGVSFSLWRAAFLADMPTRTWPQALDDARELVATVLSTNTIAFSTEHKLQGWTGGYYLLNAILRLDAVLRARKTNGLATQADLRRVRAIKLMGTDPRETWAKVCDEAEALAKSLGCELP